MFRVRPSLSGPHAQCLLPCLLLCHPQSLTTPLLPSLTPQHLNVRQIEARHLCAARCPRLEVDLRPRGGGGSVLHQLRRVVGHNADAPRPNEPQRLCRIDLNDAVQVHIAVAVIFNGRRLHVEVTLIWDDVALVLQEELRHRRLRCILLVIAIAAQRGGARHKAPIGGNAPAAPAKGLGGNAEHAGVDGIAADGRPCEGCGVVELGAEGVVFLNLQAGGGGEGKR